MKVDTILAQAGSRVDEATGALSVPVYQVATFRHPGLGKSTGYDYTRTANPTRDALEDTLALLDGGVGAHAFSSGLAALDALMRLFRPGDCILASEDPYGGSMRLFDTLYGPYGIRSVYVDTSDTAAVEQALTQQNFAALFVEIPTNPLLRVADLPALTAMARERGALTVVDNTFLTPVRCRPLDLGADIVCYSATKYLGGHNDVLAGALVSSTAELAEKIGFIQNAAGAVLGPMDCWLLLRGLKTLSLRMERQEANAQRVASFLSTHPDVARVFYPGLPEDPGHQRLSKQAEGFGAMVSFSVSDPALVPGILSSTRLFHFAESLGGCESLITFPKVQTHADIPEAMRDRLGIDDRLLRLSIGIEDADELIDDLSGALAAARQNHNGDAS